MTTRSACILVAGMILCSLILALGFGQPLAAQPPRERGSTARAGRYRAVVAGAQSLALVVIDTQTGQCWQRSPYGGDSWHDLGTPVRKKAE
jgi:hypothetical protein